MNLLSASSLWIALCFGFAGWIGHRLAHMSYCPKDGRECRDYYPPGYASLDEFLRDKDRVEKLAARPPQSDPPPEPRSK